MSLSVGCRHDITNNLARPVLSDLDMNRSWSTLNGRPTSATHQGFLDFGVDYAYSVHYLPAEGRTARAKAEAHRFHASTMQSYHREHDQSLDATWRQLGPAGNRVIPGVDVRGGRMVAGEEELEDVVRLLKEFKVDREDGTSKEVGARKGGSSEVKRRPGDHRSGMEAELLRVMDISDQVLSNLDTDHGQQMVSATDTISSIQYALSKMTETINHLYASLGSTSRDANGLSKVLEGQSARIMHLQNLVSGLRESNKTPSEWRLKGQVLQMKLVVDRAAREQAGYKKKGVSDFEHRTGQRLPEALKLLQHELGASEAKVKARAREVISLGDEAGRLQGQCKNDEQRVDGLRKELEKVITLARDLERRGRMLRDSAEKERVAVVDELEKLRRQLGDARKVDKEAVAVIRRKLDQPRRTLKERNDQIQRLVKETRSQLLDGLDRLQASVKERSGKIGDLERKGNALEGTTDQLERGLSDLEMTLDSQNRSVQTLRGSRGSEIEYW